MTELSIAERKQLRARAHALHPILQLGEKGLTDAVIAEIERALAAHELIKIRAAPLSRDAREVALASICEGTHAQAVQHIGKVLVLYRQKPPPQPDAEPGPRPRRRAKSSGWEERREARDRPVRRRKSARAQPLRRGRPRA
jgi:RNA-binding protein